MYSPDAHTISFTGSPGAQCQTHIEDVPDIWQFPDRTQQATRCYGPRSGHQVKSRLPATELSLSSTKTRPTDLVL